MPTEALTGSSEAVPTDPVEEAAIALDRVIRAEIDAIANGARELAARSRKLGEKGRGANRLRAASAVWSKELEETAKKVADEGPEVSKALLGKGALEVTTVVNPELAAAVATDPDRRKA